MAIGFRVLGPLEVSADGRVLRLGSLKQRALLGLLLVHANETLSRDRLIEELWGDAAPATVESALQVHLSRLRKQLEPAGAKDALVHEAWGYRLEVGPEALDLDRFERLVGEGREALAADKPELAGELLRAALALWRGPPLADLQSERFAIDAAARWEEERLAALEQRIEADLALGRDQELVVELEALVAEHPYRERLRAQLMLSLYRSGRQVEALEAYRQARQTLAAELGLEPGHELRELERAILANDPALAMQTEPCPAPPPAVMAPIEERKVVTVLVAALGAARDTPELDPEDLLVAQERQLNVVQPAVEKHGGRIENVTGNAVSAVFGVPRVHEDDPERAVRAALAIRDDAAGDGLGVGVGVATGEALVSVDELSRFGARVVAGEVVAVAARLATDASDAGRVVTSDRTYRATNGAVEYRQPARFGAEGAEGAAAWEALGMLSPSRRDMGGRWMGPFVGRRRELALLVDTLARVCEQREPELVTVVGAPGIGKTRLVEELRRVSEAGAEKRTGWLQGRSLPYGEGVSFWALAEVVKVQIGVLESDRDDEVEEKLRRAVTDVVGDGREAAWVHHHLRPVLGIVDANAADGGDRDEKFAAWRRFFEALATRRPLVVVFEDLQWAEETLLDFVEGLAEWIGVVPLLVLATGRPELLDRRPRWGGGRQNSLVLSLGPLADDESAALLVALSQHRARTDEDADLLARIGGNPFFAEQYARAIGEHPQTRNLPLPDSVQAMIAARLDVLSAAEKSVLQDAAVIGKVFWTGATSAVGDAERSEAEQQLRTLERKQFLQRALDSAVAGESEYAFRHLLLRDVAYTQIPRAARAAKHQAAAAWIESLGRPQDHAEALAHHYECALELTEAAGGDSSDLAVRTRQALRDAGDRTLALNAPAAAASYFERALALCPEDDDDRPQLLFRYGSALGTVGDVRGEGVLTHARRLLLDAGDLETAAEADALVAGMWWQSGDRGALLHHLASAVALARECPSSAAKARVLTRIARLQGLCWQFPDAIRAGREALAIAEALDLPELRAEALTDIGVARWATGVAAGRADIERALELALAHNALRAASHAYADLAAGMLVKGELKRRDEVLAEAEALERHLGAPQRVRLLRAYRMGAWRPDWDNVLQFADDFIAQCQAGSPDSFEPQMRVMRALIRLARDDADGAVADCELALAEMRRIRRPDTAVMILGLSGTVYLELGRVDDARQLVDELFSYEPNLARLMSPEFTWDAERLGRRREIVHFLSLLPADSLWRRAGELILADRYGAAAELFAEMGTPPYEARARVRAAEKMLREDDDDQAEAQLLRALGFYRSVRATRYIRQVESVLAAARPVTASDQARV